MSKKLKAIAIAAMAVCAISAVSASAAQAAPHWTKGGVAFSGTAKLTEPVVLTKVEAAESQPSSTLTVPGLLNLTCTSLKAKGAEIFGNTEGSAEALTFEGCIVSSLPTTCQVHSIGSAVGTIATGSLTARLPVTPAGDVIFKPTGEFFVEIKVEAKTGKSCGPSGTYKVTGEAALQGQLNTNATYLEGTASQAIQEAWNATAGAVPLKFGARNAFLDATGDLALESHETWGIGNP